MLENKTILDACCGSKMFWFDKNKDNVIYCDNRSESHVLCDGRTLEIKPDLQIDFRNMPFPDRSFKLVVFDPPHLSKLGKDSWLAKKYGILGHNWETDIHKGFLECMRVLEVFGILIFKWSCHEIKVKEILDILPCSPLFGHTTGRSGKTIWMTFMKGDEDADN